MEKRARSVVKKECDTVQVIIFNIKYEHDCLCLGKSTAFVHIHSFVLFCIYIEKGHQQTEQCFSLWDSETRRKEVKDFYILHE